MTDSGIIGGLDVLDVFREMDFGDRVEKEMKKMNRLSIINIGKTGVGKSTIINAVFCNDLAKTGIGKPVTQHCESYSLPDSPITIYDSKGIETGQDNTVILGEIYNKIKEQNSSANTDSYIHICWYCVLDSGNRLEQNEIDIIKKIRRIIPVIIVITQAIGGPAADAFISEIEKDFSEQPIDIIPIMALPLLKKSEHGEMNIKQHGLEKLVERSYDLLPESVKRTFAAYQKNSIQLKTKHAFIARTLYSGAVAAAAFQPLPIADAPIMVAIQVAMMANITACFGIKPSDFNLKTVLTGLGGPFAAAAAGRTVVSLLKAIPGVGTLIGGGINAATGGAITFALGSLYIKVLSSIAENKGKIDAAGITEALNRAAKSVDMDKMKEEWEKNKNTYSKSEAGRIAEDAKKDAGK